MLHPTQELEPPANPVRFRLLIRMNRERLNFSQEEFADHINLDRSNYGAIERGERNISVYTLARIALGLKVEVGELFPPLKALHDL